MNRAKTQKVVMRSLLYTTLLASLACGSVAWSQSSDASKTATRNSKAVPPKNSGAASKTGAGSTSAPKTAVSVPGGTNLTTDIKNAGNSNTAKRVTPSTASGKGGGIVVSKIRPPHPFYPANMPKLPSGITKRVFDTNSMNGPLKRDALWRNITSKGINSRGVSTAKLKGAKSRAPGDQAVIRQTILLTKSSPNAAFSITPAQSLSEHPFWTADEQYVYFDSNRQSDQITTIGAGNFNIFRMVPDGSGVVQINADPNNNQLDPNVSSDGGTVAYVSGGQFTVPNGLAVPVTTGFNLFIFNLNNKTAGATQLTGATNAALNFSDVRHPSWSPGGNLIAFAGKLQGDTLYHIFAINISTGAITQYTAGTSNDYSPAFSPDGNLIAFTTNANGFAASTAPISAAALANNDDIYVISQSAFQPRPTRVTNFAANGVQSSNRNCSWSSRKVDPLNLIPPENDPNGNALPQSEQFLAFASTRQDTNQDGIANNVGATTDVYYMHAQIRQVTPGIFTVSTPESAGNPAHKLRTSEPDTAIDPNEPTYKFDPNFTSNEDFPTWPQYQNSYRIVYQSDRGGLLEIWGSTILDIDAPSLLKYDLAANEIVHVALNSAPNVAVRQVNAGQDVRFRVRAVDYESGVESVYLQIKCPNSSPLSVDSTEHKVFLDPGSGTAFLDNATTVIDPPFELDAQAVDANATLTNNYPRFKAKGVNGVGNANWPGGNLYLPGLQDNIAFSGGLNPPDDPAFNPADGQGGCWLKLWDDGPISQGGHEPEGEVAGDGIYTNVWTTPPTMPSDWLIDVIIRDLAINPFDTSATTNWKIYDNVWGFTTQPFQASSQCLYVSDYDTGQKFFTSRVGTGNFAANTNFLGVNFNGTPTESYMTEYDSGLIPTSALRGLPVPFTNVRTNLGQNSYGTKGTLSYDALDDDNSGFPPTQHYDIWRIQCRGPIPDSVLNAYAPHYEAQAFDPVTGTTPAPRLVAERCVFWHAPYSGDLFVGPGTLLDSTVQLQLTNFVGAGGRLFVCGQDVAFGLTLGGTVPNAFLNNVLHAQFYADDGFAYGGANTDQLTMTQTDPAGHSRGGLPIGWETFYSFAHQGYNGTVVPDTPPATMPVYIGSTASAARTYNCPNLGGGIGTPDLVSFIDDGVTPTFKANIDDVDARYTIPGLTGFNSVGPPAVMWYTDTTAHSKIVYSPFGWEAINPETYGNVVSMNRRTEMTHNVLDYLRTGRIIGTIRTVNSSNGATQPLAGVTVRATDVFNNLYTVKSQGDGSFTLNGLEANGIYALDVVAVGYVTQHAAGTVFHGGYQGRQDFYLTQAQPATVTGTITTFGTGLPVGGAIVTATDISDPTNLNPPTYSSGASDPTTGKYTINNLPPSKYSLAISNLVPLGFIASVPATITITPTAGQLLTMQNFQVKEQPGSISGKVDVADANGNDTGVPIPGATIVATSGTTSFTTAPPAPGGSAANGTYIIPGVGPGVYGVVASAPGYTTSKSKTATVVTKTDTGGVNFALIPIPPGAVSGLVSTSGGLPVANATITVTDAAGHVTTTTSGAVQTVTDPTTNTTYSFNYKVSPVAAGGNVTVTAAEAGYTPKPNPDTQTVAIAQGTETKGVNFTLDPLFVYNPTLTLVSNPYQFTQNGAVEPVTTLLGIPNADVTDHAFEFVTWNATTQSYIYYPTAPATGFVLGLGYFLADTDSAVTLALTDPTGATAPKDASGNYLPFNIPLQNGWNMIGDPFTLSLDISKLQIQLANGNLVDVPAAQAGGTPYLGAALWTYDQGAYSAVFTIDPYRGYWIRAFQPVTLIVTPGAAISRGVTAKTRSALDFANGHTGDFKLELDANINNKPASKSYLGTHRAAADTYDQFKLQSPPPVGAQNVTVTFDHNDWGTKSGSYSVDVRSVQATGWDFTVRSNIPNVPVTLTWPNLATTGRHNMTLTDLDTQTKFEIHNRASYVIPGSAQPLTRHFHMDVLPPTRQNLQLMNLAAYVDATSRGVRAASASISYTLTADATVEVAVLKGGRRVRTLETGNTRSAGAVQSTWDMKNDHGVGLPADVYTVEVRAVDKDGHQVRETKPLVITR